MSFFDASNVRLVYPDLNASLTYGLQVVFNSQAEPANIGTGSSPGVMRLVARGVDDTGAWQEPVTVWPAPPAEYAYAPVPMQKTEVFIDKNLTKGGKLELSCSQPPGLPGNGRTCQISAVWLVVVPES